MNQSTHKKEIIWSVFWFCGFVLAYLLFFPVVKDGDFFGCFIAVYTYFYLSLLFVWTRFLMKKPNSATLAMTITKLVLVLAILYPIGSYFYNGRMSFIRNAAENDYPLVLNMFLDESNQEELDLALYFAKVGKNPQIVEELKAKGAKSR